MIWYKYLYLGETAKKHRFSILQKLRLGKVQPGVHVITLPQADTTCLISCLPMCSGRIITGSRRIC